MKVSTWTSTVLLAFLALDARKVLVAFPLKRGEKKYQNYKDVKIYTTKLYLRLRIFLTLVPQNYT